MMMDGPVVDVPIVVVEFVALATGKIAFNAKCRIKVSLVKRRELSITECAYSGSRVND